MKTTITTSITCALTLLIGCFSLSAQDQDTYIHGNLKPGPYEVGFDVFHEYDHTRTYSPEFTDDGLIVQTASPRPMQIAVWYPARKQSADQYMAYRDFYYLDATVENPLREVNDQVRFAMDQAFENQQLFTGPANREKIGHFLSMKTRSILDAEAKEGSFPLIIYSPREYRGVYYNTQLIEHLVSNGFIVATTPNKDNVSAVTQGPRSIEVLQANIDDLRYVKGFMSTFPHVDKDRIGVVGWAWGAASAIALAEADPNISAVVSLDGSVRFSGQRAFLEGLPGYATSTLSKPILHLETSNPSNPSPIDYSFYDEIKYADAYHVAFRDAQWFTPSTYFYLVHAKGTANPDQFDFERLDRAHTGMITYTQQFFSAYLQNDKPAQAWLSHPSRQNEFEEGEISIRSKKGIPLPPSPAVFTSLFTDRGADVARKVWDRVQHENPGYQIAPANSLNNLGYTLLGLGRTGDAVEAFKLQVEAYPHLANAWDSMGEGYKNNGEDAHAIKAFKKSLSLNPPQNVKSNSISLLQELGIEYEEPAPHPLKAKEAQKLAGTYTLSINNQTLTSKIWWEENRLLSQTAGQPQVELVQKEKGIFWAYQNEQALGITVVFEKGNHREARTIKVTNPQGQTSIGHRQDGHGETE